MKSFLQGQFMNHPLHPALVHLPIGLWLASTIFDVTFMAKPVASLASASYYCMSLGLLGALFASVAGFADYLSIPSATIAKRLATSHFLLNLVIIALFAINLFARYRVDHSVPATVSAGQLFLSFLSIVLLAVSGYIGGLLVFEYSIGYRPAERLSPLEETKDNHGDDRKRVA